MIFGMGIDHVKIERIQHLIETYSTHFITYTFTSQEAVYCQKKKNPFPSFAVRFAAKEAYSKAIGTGIGEYAAFNEIEVRSQDNGKPSLHLHGATKDKLLVLLSIPTEEQDKIALHVSLSHDHSYAIAQVMVEVRNE